MGNESKAPTRTPLWRNISFTLMWTSTAASGYGDRMIMLGALALLGGLAKNSDSSSIQASTQFFFFLPYLLFNLVGGWLADHLPRKWLLLACDECRGLLLLGACLVLAGASGDSAIPGDQHWKVWAVLAAIGTFAAIFNPTRNAIVPQIVRPEQLQPANACILVINVVASMVGMILGTYIISESDIGTVRKGLMLGALFFMVSGTFFAFMRPTHQVAASASSNSRSLMQAARYARQHKRVITLIGVNTMVWGSAAIVSTGVMGVVKIHHGAVGDELLRQFGILAALMGVGMVVGAAAVVLLRTMRESAIVLSFGLIMAGLCVLMLALVPVYAVSYLACFGVGFFGNIAIISALTVLQSISPNYIRGRIMGLNSMINTIFTISVYGIIWQMPKADYWVITLMIVLGPALIATGAWAVVRYLVNGPMPNRKANVFWRLTRLFCFSVHRLQVTGKHHMPSGGPVVIASNHTTAMDPFLIQASSIRMVRWLMLTSYRIKLGEPLWRAIDPICLEHDKSTGTAEPGIKQVRQIVRELKKGDVVGVFPEGHLQYDDRVLKPFEDGAAVMARLSKAAIVPCWIEGTVISRSMLKHVLKPTHSKVTFGPPFTPDPAMPVEELTAEIRKRMIALRDTDDPDAPSAGSSSH